MDSWRLVYWIHCVWGLCCDLELLIAGCIGTVQTGTVFLLSFDVVHARASGALCDLGMRRNEVESGETAVVGDDDDELVNDGMEWHSADSALVCSRAPEGEEVFDK